MVLDAGVSRLIGDIYAGADDPAAWERAIRGLIDRTGSRWSLISIVDLRQRGYMASEIFGPDDARFLDGMQHYNDEYFAEDPMLQFAMRNPQVGSVNLRQSITGSGLEFEDHPFVRWCYGALRTGDSTVFYSAPREGVIFGASIHTPHEQRVYDEADIALFRLLFGHMENALRIATRPPDFTSLDDARLLLDRHGRLLAMSPAAEAIVTRGDGLLLLTGGGLTALRRQDSQRIEQLVSSAAAARIDGGSGGILRVPRVSGRRDYVLFVSPMPNPPGPFAAFRPCVQVRIVDPDVHPAPDAAARWLFAFGLTPAEARLAEALIASDCDLRRAADHCAVTYATVRSQLASIFRKTDTHGQAQLVRLLTLTGG